MNKLLVIGLDSASLKLINPWVEAGDLPHLASLMGKGVVGKLKSVVPPMSPPAWTTFMTGKNQGKHGIYDFTMRVPDSYDVDFTNATFRKTDTIWHQMTSAGKKVCSIGIPMTYPPEREGGTVISGMDAPGPSWGEADASAFNPPELYDEITREVGNYVIAMNLPPTEQGDVEKCVNAISEVVNKKMTAALYLYPKEDWDCFMICIGETDTVSHLLWKYHDSNSPFWENTQNCYTGEDPIFKIYQLVDQYIGALVKLAGPETNVIVMSDHGMDGCATRVIYPNCWLGSCGFLKFKNLGKEAGVTGLVKQSLSKGVGVAQRFGQQYLPQGIKKQLLRKTEIITKVMSQQRFANICWQETRAFFDETPYFPNLWVNVKGRDPEGIVEPGQEYEDVRDALIKELQQWSDPESGNPVVRKVHKREELYSGAQLESAPDLVIEWNQLNGYSYLFKSSRQTTPGDQPIRPLDPEVMHKTKTGEHTDYGLLIAAGPDIRMSAQIEGAKLIDLAPTLLSLVGQSVPEDMDGRLLDQLLTPGFMTDNPVKFHGSSAAEPLEQQDDAPVYSETDKEIIRKRLKDLGYME